MPVINMEVTGLKELEARLLELDTLAAKRLLTRATRRSLIKLERRATANAESLSRSGALAESIRIVTVKPKGSETVAVQVGPKKRDRRGVALHNLYYKRKRKGIFYGHLIEFGHRVGTRSTGWLVSLSRRRRASSAPRTSGSGTVNARPWFMPAWNATRTEIVPELKRILAQGLSRIEKRQRQRAAQTEGLVDP